MRNVMLDKINSEAAAQLHLDLMKKCLTRYIFPDPNSPLTVVNQSASILLLGPYILLYSQC